MLRRRDYAQKKISSASRGFASRSASPRRIFNIVSAALVFVVLINVGFALANSTVAAVEIRGLKIARLETVVALVSDQLDKKRWWLLPQQVMLFFDTGRVRRLLEHEFPFATWSVSKEVTGMVKIAAKERTAALLWVSGGRAHYVDATGEVFAVADSPRPTTETSGRMEVFRHQTLGTGVPIVMDVQNHQVTDGDHPLSQQTVQFILEVATALDTGEVKPAPEVTGWRFDRKLYQLTAETLGGYEIFFASNQNVRDQLHKLAAAMRQGIGKRPGLQYIDVRFGQKIFYQETGSGR